MRIQGYLALVLGVCLTVWTCLLVADAQQARISATFERDADKVAADTGARLQVYFDVLLGMKAAFEIEQNLDRDQFARFVKALRLTERYPGFQAIQFVRYVPSADLAAFADSVQNDPRLLAQAHPPFVIHPQAGGDEHFIIDYNEPMKGNENAFGLDLAALPPHLAALRYGRDSGEIAATERITLVQDATGQPGFVARAPVYRQNMPLASVAQRRAALIGMVAIVFKVNSLMREVIDPALMDGMAVRIHDTGIVGANAPASEKNIMFDTSSAKLPVLEGLHAKRLVNVAQRRWLIQIDAVAGSRYSRNLANVVLVGAGGLVVSVLISALLFASHRSRKLTGKLRATLDEQRAFQDSASVGIALFSRGVIKRCNLGMEQMMGYGPGELIGMGTSVLLPQRAHDAIDPFTTDPNTPSWQSELELVRHDGSTIWCLVDGKPLDASEPGKGGVWVVKDISDRKQAEAALVDAKHGLEHSLAELAQQKANVESAHTDLSAVLETLKQAQNNLITSEKMASLGSLVAGIAHELNTPIGNSLLMATALSDMVDDFESKFKDGGVKRSALEAHLTDTRLACSIMASSLKRAADLITSFKQVAVDQTSDKRRSFDLCEVVHDTLATFAAQLRRANCEVSVAGPPALILDSYPGSLGQVLSNLINNALLHAFEGRSDGALQISIRELDAEHAQLVFGDNGVGMPPKVLHQVFDPFFTTKMGQGGSGLGMNIVYNIVTGMLGGTIDIVSSPEDGTRVTITLPTMAPDLDNDDAAIDLLLA